MIASMQLADLGTRRAAAAMRDAPQPGRTPGLIYADALVAADLGGTLLPRPRPGRAALFTVWHDDAALDRFLAEDPLARPFAGGCSIRLTPLRASGGWRGLEELVDGAPATADDEPVAVLTYGRLKLHRAGAFLRASARAEADAVAGADLLFGTGLARPPRLVSTFSLWRTAAAMRDFAHHGAGHSRALAEVARRDFHHESIFIRWRPYAATGDWGELPASTRERLPARPVAYVR